MQKTFEVIGHPCLRQGVYGEYRNLPTKWLNVIENHFPLTFYQPYWSSKKDEKSKMAEKWIGLELTVNVRESKWTQKLWKSEKASCNLGHQVSLNEKGFKSIQLLKSNQFRQMPLEFTQVQTRAIIILRLILVHVFKICCPKQLTGATWLYPQIDATRLLIWQIKQ